MNKKKLKNELLQAGAIKTEISQLVTLADNIQLLLSQPKKIKYRLNFFLVGLLSTTCLVVGAFVVSLSQTTLPGNILYPVQRLSDTVALSIDPNYRETIMMKQAEQVNRLVGNHADRNLVLAALADYQVQASAYQATSKNYAALEYCKTNLEEAASIAPQSERQAIDATLLSLKMT